jgi:hypothetical protein
MCSSPSLKLLGREPEVHGCPAASCEQVGLTVRKTAQRIYSGSAMLSWLIQFSNTVNISDYI